MSRFFKHSVAFLCFIFLSIVFLGSGCQSLNSLPQPPPGQPLVGQPPVVGQEGTGGSPSRGSVGPPNEQNSILISANINKVKPDLLEGISGQQDVFFVKNATCTIVFSDSEKVDLRLIVRKFGDTLAFGTLLSLRKPPEKYKIAESVKFQMPGCKDVLFKNVRITDKKLLLPDVVLEPIK